MKKKVSIVTIIFITALITSIASAATFYLIFNETPFKPNQYSWEEPWQVKEMVDFVEITLTLTGCAYEGQSHDVELVLTNVATISDYYLASFDYSAKWYVDETHQESIIAGTYAGDPLAIGESILYTDVWVPTVIGIGIIKLNVIDIIWSQGEPIPITWAKDTQFTGAYWSEIKVENFEIIGATMSLTESGIVSFRLNNINTVNAITCTYKVEIVELGITIAEGIDLIQKLTSKDYSFAFDPLPSGGLLTMLISIIAES